MRVVAYFDSPGGVARASNEAERTGWQIVAVMSPAFDEQLLRVAGTTRSPVALSAVIGGVVGVAAGVVLTVGTVRQWPGLIVGGKPLLSMPPFLIIIFELAILFASIAAVWTFLTASARARRRVQVVPDPATTDNQFALLIESGPNTTEQPQSLFERTRAVAWRPA